MLVWCGTGIPLTSWTFLNSSWCRRLSSATFSFRYASSELLPATSGQMAPKPSFWTRMNNNPQVASRCPRDRRQDRHSGDTLKFMPESRIDAMRSTSSASDTPATEDRTLPSTRYAVPPPTRPPTPNPAFDSNAGVFFFFHEVRCANASFVVATVPAIYPDDHDNLGFAVHQLDRWAPAG
jgi:hypothetical protein